MSAQPEIPPVVVIEPTTSGENTVAVATPVDQSAKAVAHRTYDHCIIALLRDPRPVPPFLSNVTRPSVASSGARPS